MGLLSDTFTKDARMTRDYTEQDRDFKRRQFKKQQSLGNLYAKHNKGAQSAGLPLSVGSVGSPEAIEEIQRSQTEPAKTVNEDLGVAGNMMNSAVETGAAIVKGIKDEYFPEAESPTSPMPI